jgi:hypothetical protein
MTRGTRRSGPTGPAKSPHRHVLRPAAWRAVPVLRAACPGAAGRDRRQVRRHARVARAAAQVPRMRRSGRRALAVRNPKRSGWLDLAPDDQGAGREPLFEKGIAKRKYGHKQPVHMLRRQSANYLINLHASSPSTTCRRSRTSWWRRRRCRWPYGGAPMIEAGEWAIKSAVGDSRGPLFSARELAAEVYRAMASLASQSPRKCR